MRLFVFSYLIQTNAPNFPTKTNILQFSAYSMFSSLGKCTFHMLLLCPKMHPSLSPFSLSHHFFHQFFFCLNVRSRLKVKLSVKPSLDDSVCPFVWVPWPSPPASAKMSCSVLGNYLPVILKIIRDNNEEVQNPAHLHIPRCWNAVFCLNKRTNEYFFGH